MIKSSRCKEYVGINCVDGTCPIALSDLYEEYCMDVVKSCKDCWYYKGCEDCLLYDTPECKNGGLYGKII